MSNLLVKALSEADAEGFQTFEVQRRSPFSGKMNTMTLRFDAGSLEAWLRGEMLIQDAFPHLNADEREFIKTGITAEEWPS
ncbi:hypothetical protein DSS3PM1_00084 [Bacteriophage DSS3_PM1]|nr:hypothetical protein DSS3PM1_00084 [Bacteriophage DSS3_PM1]